MTKDNTIERYVSRFKKALKDISFEERTDLSNELRTHLEERSLDGEEALSQAFGSLGKPEDYARKFNADAHLRDALSRPGIWPVFRHSFRTSSDSIVSFSVFALALCGYAIAMALLVVGCLEPFLGDRAGLHMGDGTFFWGVLEGEPLRNSKDVLGFWALPVGILSGAALFVATSRSLRAFLLRQLERDRAKQGQK